MKALRFEVPGEAPSTPNLREHWAVKAKRVANQRAKVRRRWPGWEAGPLLVVRLTRVAPRALDTDNLAAALKGHRDSVASCLRVDDATPLVRWDYAQEKGPAAVRVEVLTLEQWRHRQEVESLPSPNYADAGRDESAPAHRCHAAAPCQECGCRPGYCYCLNPVARLRPRPEDAPEAREVPDSSPSWSPKARVSSAYRPGKGGQP